MINCQSVLDRLYISDETNDKMTLLRSKLLSIILQVLSRCRQHCVASDVSLIAITTSELFIYQGVVVKKICGYKLRSLSSVLFTDLS